MKMLTIPSVVMLLIMIVCTEKLHHDHSEVWIRWRKKLQTSFQLI